MGKRVLIVAPVHQSEKVFKEYIEHINKLEIPENYEVNKLFILHNCEELSKYLNNGEYSILNDGINYSLFDHKFTAANYYILAEMRTALLDYARDHNYDYVYSVDSNVLIHPKSLKLLLQDNKDIVGMINWSTAQGNSTAIVPNGYDMEYWQWWQGYNSYLLKKGVWEIGVISATLLIGPRILQEKRINYYPVLGAKCSQWEDYAFSLRAHCLIPNLQMYMDTRLPSRHLYREKDYLRWMMDKEKYE